MTPTRCADQGPVAPPSYHRATAMVLHLDGLTLVTRLRLLEVCRDKELVAVARRVAFDLVNGDPALDRLPELRDEIPLLLDEEDRTFLFKS
jgi:hypothetical protein